MILILDTDHLTVIERGAEPGYSNLLARLKSFSEADVRTTIVSFEEQMRGWLSLISRAKNKKQEISAYERLHSLLMFFSQIPVMKYDGEAAEEFSRLRHLRLRVGPMDLKIASIAISNNAVLLSRNLKDFTRVPILDVYDWTIA